MANKNNKVSVKAFRGATVEDMNNFINPTIRAKPDKLILHIGTNNLASEATPRQISDKIVDLCQRFENDSPSTNICISEIIFRNDKQDLNNKALKVNKVQGTFFRERQWTLFPHSLDKSCLTSKRLH